MLFVTLHSGYFFNYISNPDDYTCHVFFNSSLAAAAHIKSSAALHNACILFDLTHDSDISLDILWTKAQSKVSTSIWLKNLNMHKYGLLQRCSIHKPNNAHTRWTPSRDSTETPRVCANISRRRVNTVISLDMCLFSCRLKMTIMGWIYVF